MKKACIILMAATTIGMLTACHSNPHNSFGGPSKYPQDTAAKKRDTSSSTH